MEWRRIDETFIASESRSGDDLKRGLERYFDGGAPRWEVVLSDIPRREAARRIMDDLVDAPAPHRTLHLVLGASGEGKSTVVRQVAVDVARHSPSWEVFFRAPGGERLLDRTDPWPEERQFLFVADDADEIARECYDAVGRLGGRRNLHLLFAAHGAGWRVLDDELSWTDHDFDVRKHTLRGVDAADALEIVEAWARYGALGQLASYNSAKDRAGQLHKAAREESATSEGALLGGMLRVRFGEHLDAHVLTMIRRLVKRKLPVKHTLAYAFVLIAALHAIGAEEKMTPDLLAQALGIDPSDVRGEVIDPLGDEAAAARVGGWVRIRHRAVAESAIRVVRQLTAMNLPTMYAEVVKAGFALHRRRPATVDLKDFRYLSLYLKDDPESALAAASASFDEEPDDLQALVNLFVVQGRNGLNDEIAHRAERAMPKLHEMRRVSEARSRFFHEWAIAEGKRGNPAIDVWLTGVSLADLPHTKALRDEDAEVRPAGMGSALHALAESTGDEVYRRGLRAIEVLLRDYPVRHHVTRRTVARHRAAAEKLEIPEASFADSKVHFVAAVQAAYAHRERNLPARVPNGASLTFTALFKILEHH